MYIILRKIKWILCFMWNYSVRFTACPAVRPTVSETEQPPSYSPIVSRNSVPSGKRELPFCWQAVQPKGDPAHGKCWLWSSPFSNRRRCHTVFIPACWGSTEKTTELTSKPGTLSFLRLARWLWLRWVWKARRADRQRWPAEAVAVGRGHPGLGLSRHPAAPRPLAAGSARSELLDLGIPLVLLNWNTNSELNGIYGLQFRYRQTILAPTLHR